MIYLKSFVVGIVAAIVTSALWIVGSFVIPVFGPFLLARWNGEGSYGGGTVIGSGSVLLAALIGFVAGLGWTFRRSRRLVAQR
jgi:hypothetical protein